MTGLFESVSLHLSWTIGERSKLKGLLLGFVDLTVNSETFAMLYDFSAQSKVQMSGITSFFDTHGCYLFVCVCILSHDGCLVLYYAE